MSAKLTSTGPISVFSYNGRRVQLGVASSMARIELPSEATHVAIYVETGAADFFVHLWPDADSHGAASLEAVSGVSVLSGQWHTIPVRAARVGLTVTSANKTLHGGNPIILVVPEVDPVVAFLRSQR
jgi:hypothetical protein